MLRFEDEVEGVDDEKLVAVELGEEGATLVEPCATVLAAVPLLQSCDIKLKAADGVLFMEVFHREDMRRFQVGVDRDGLVNAGFTNYRDTLDDCLAILRECLVVSEDSSGVKREVAVTPMVVSGSGQNASASAALSIATETKCPFAECSLLRVKFTEDLGRGRPYEYQLDLALLKMEPLVRSELMTQALRETVRALGVEVKAQTGEIKSLGDAVRDQCATIQAQSDEIASLKMELKKSAEMRGAVVLYQSNEVNVDLCCIWKQASSPSVAHVYSLSRDKQSVRIQVSGFYRITARIEVKHFETQIQIDGGTVMKTRRSEMEDGMKAMVGVFHVSGGELVKALAWRSRRTPGPLASARRRLPPSDSDSDEAIVGIGTVQRSGSKPRGRVLRSASALPCNTLFIEKID